MEDIEMAVTNFFSVCVPKTVKYKIDISERLPYFWVIKNKYEEYDYEEI